MKKISSVAKKNIVIRILLSCVVLTFVSLACTMYTLAWFISNRQAEDQAIDGEVGLRDYFYNGDGYNGDGSYEHPHEIVTPTHFYNLTRLQNLGVLYEKTYFRIGHVFEGHEDEGPKCLDEYNQKVDVLDMTDYCDTYGALLPIGNEGTPFNGDFDGNLIPIVGLKVAGNPEDIGVFGYTSYSSDIKNLVFKDLEVSSLGYSKTDESNFLYSEEIKKIFDENAKNFELASLSFVTTYEEIEHNHNLKTTEVFVVEDIGSNDKSEEIHDPDSQFDGNRIVLGKFVPSFPTIAGHSNIEYSISSSTGVITKEEDTNNLVIDLSRLPADFNTESPVRMISNISLAASVKINGIKYSRVIQTYSVEIRYDRLIEDGPLVLILKVSCDHVLDPDDNNNPINFGHGNNIGYVVGHADGNVYQCYVYNGTLLLNPSNALTAIESQTEIGLIGKIGNNVTTDLDPTSSATTKGETGVLNFSYIYSLIREPFAAGDETHAGYFPTYNTSTGNVDGPYKSFIAYAKEKWDGSKYVYDDNDRISGTESSSFDLFKEYLRTNNADKDTVHHNTLYYITSAGSQSDIINVESQGRDYTVPSGNLDEMMDSVDFRWNKVICDGVEENEKRGFGVFKVVTGYSSLANNDNIASAVWRNDIGDFSIVHEPDSKAKTEIYFSTAECDWTKGGGWNKATGDISPASMNTLPTYTDTKSFEYPFSRDFNYLFRLNLNEAENFKKGMDIYNYMYDTDSLFLKNYLSSILIDRFGAPVAPGNKGFGFKVQFSQDILSPVTKLSSYIKVGKPTSLNQYTVNGQTGYYPQKSIVFSIDNPNGANVSIAGCDGDISIYSYNPESSSASSIQELYTMRSKYSDANGYGRFFEYSSDGSTSTTSTIVEPQGDGMNRKNYLYGHIFKLPRGNYVIGSSKNTDSNSAKVYYVCVQGQTNGDMGEMEIATIGNYVTKNDFLLKDPTVEPLDLDDESFFAEFSFKGTFSSDFGKMVVDTTEVGDVTYVRARFNDFITYLMFYCRKNYPDATFKLNEDALTTLPFGEFTYDGPYVTYTDWS